MKQVALTPTRVLMFSCKNGSSNENALIAVIRLTAMIRVVALRLNSTNSNQKRTRIELTIRIKQGALSKWLAFTQRDTMNMLREP